MSPQPTNTNPSGNWPLWCAACLLLLEFSQVIVGAAPSLTDPDRGLFYTNVWIRSVPWSVHVLKIERSRTNLALVTNLGRNQVLELTPLTDKIRSIPAQWGRPLAAINGDFYKENEPFVGDPRGIQILRGELVSAPDGKPCFWIDSQNVPHIGHVVPQLKVIWPSGEGVPCGLNEERRSNGAILYTARAGFSTCTSDGSELVLERLGQNAWLPLLPGQSYTARVRQVRARGNSRLSNDTLVLSLGPAMATRVPALAAGATVKILTSTSPDLSGAQTAIGGGPILVRGGKSQRSYDHKSEERHPRSAIGWNSNYYILVAVDGRQPRLSMGMTLAEFATFLVNAGCDEAMNLDGGASVELWIGGRIVNSPCHGHERSTANALILLQTDQPQQARLQPGSG